jgi:trk system potassium uptake protein TrkH
MKPHLRRPLLLTSNLLMLLSLWLMSFLPAYRWFPFVALVLIAVSLTLSVQTEWEELRAAHDPFRWLVGHSFEWLLLLLTPWLAYSNLQWLWLLGLRQVIVSIRLFSRMHAVRRFFASLLESPAQLMLSSFGFVTLLGTLTLMLPRATTNGQGLAFLEALFTSTSATCVTGLVVKSTPKDFTLFGQLTILLLIQIGGIGVMTLSSFLLGTMGRRLGLRSKSALGALMDEPESHRVAYLLRFTIGATLLTEFVGMLFLYWRWSDPAMKVAQPFYFAFFHSISAFCNAGFSLWDSSLIPVQTDVVSNVVLMGLIIAGGLGFPVLASLTNRELWQRFRQYWARQNPWRTCVLTFRMLPLNTKLVLTFTPILIIAGWIGFLGFEWNRSLGHLGLFDKGLASLFQSVTLRTAGFNSVDFSQLGPATLFLMIFFMLIGGASGGTAGGIKVNTIAVTFISLVNVLRQRAQVQVFERVIARPLVYKASVVLTIFAILFSVSFLILLSTQSKIPFEHLMFEVASAFGTVGLSVSNSSGASTTSLLNDVGRWVIIFAMFVGRVGPLTLAFAVSGNAEKAEYTYPKEHISIG